MYFDVYLICDKNIQIDQSNFCYFEFKNGIKYSPTPDPYLHSFFKVYLHLVVSKNTVEDKTEVRYLIITSKFQE